MHLSTPFLALLAIASSALAWLPASGKIRGVNLGSLFVFEPVWGENEWSNMGCGSYQSEFDCVNGLGQSAANSAFQGHWANWITQDDISLMTSYGLNTIRIPVGYWMDESSMQFRSLYLLPRSANLFLLSRIAQYHVAFLGILLETALTFLVLIVVYSSEHFPQGGIAYLEKVCGWARSVLDLLFSVPQTPTM